MYSFLNVEQIIDFLLRFNINFLELSPFEQSVVLLLSNIFYLLFIIFALSFIYKMFWFASRVGVNITT